MPIQDTVGAQYPTRTALGFPGMLAEITGIQDVCSRRVENAAVAFGLAVGRGAADNSVRTGGAGFEGITICDKTRSADSFAVGEQAAVLRKGSVWVTASTAVTPADPVTFTAATGVIGAGLATTITGAKFGTTAAAGGLVRVYLG